MILSYLMKIVKYDGKKYWIKQPYIYDALNPTIFYYAEDLLQ